MKSIKWGMLSVLPVLGFLVSSDSHATYFTCCSPAQIVRRPSSLIAMYRLPTGFPAGNAFTARITEAAAIFVPVSGTLAAMSILTDADDAWSNSNSTDETFWLANAPDEITLAQNFWRFSNGVYCNGYQPCCIASPSCAAPTLVEADVAFYVNRATTGAWIWNTAQPSAMVNTTTFPLYFAVTAVHEFAHAFGIDHDTAGQGLSTMDPGFPFGGWALDEVAPELRATVMANTAGNLGGMYPGGGGGSDVYIASTFHDSTPPAGGSFGRALSCDAATSACDYYPRRTTQIPGQTFATARVGDSIKFRACWGNRSSTNQTTSLAFDIAFSSNTLLDASDPRVGANTWSVASVPAGSATCSELTVVVPNLAVGTWNIVFGLGGTTGNDVGMVNRRVNVIL